MINVSDHITSELKESYFLLVKKYLDGPKRNRLNRAVNDSNTNDEKDAFKYIQKNLRKIILVPPHNLSSFDSELSTIKNSDFFKQRMTHFYEDFMRTKINEIIENDNPDWDENNQKTVAYWLLKKLNIRTCPYCNRNYTFTVTLSTGTLIRPEFDHFFPKTEKPWLALSFYNLVPSCPTCNHTKGVDIVSDNPYKRIPSDISIEYEAIKDTIKVRPEENLNVKVFGLQHLYEEHIDYARDVFKKAIAYNPDIYDVLLNSFQGTVKTREELERIIWGVYLEEDKLDKRPLSKLTLDILKQLGLR